MQFKITRLQLNFDLYHSCQLSIINLLYKNFQEEQLNSKRFPVFPEGISNSCRFQVFPEVVDTLYRRWKSFSICLSFQQNTQHDRHHTTAHAHCAQSHAAKTM